MFLLFFTLDAANKPSLHYRTLPKKESSVTAVSQDFKAGFKMQPEKCEVGFESLPGK